MKKGLFILLFIYSFSHKATATTCVGSVQLFTQADVNAFVSCDTIDGNLEITSMVMGSSDITDLSPLSGVSVVTGILMIRDVPPLTILNGLDGLQKADQLMIENNPNLTNINALAGLNVVSGFITINTNPLLSQCCAIVDAINPMFPMLFQNDAKNGSGCNSMAEIQADASCRCRDIACYGRINVSIDNSCGVQVTPQMLLTDTTGLSADSFNINYLDLSGNPIDEFKVNERINVMISIAGCEQWGSTCWTEVLIEDKLPPVIDCAERDTIMCYEMDSIRYPSTFDFCDNDVTIELVNQEFQSLCEGDTIIGVSRRTFRAIDAAGNISDTCTTDVYIKTPKINNISFPTDTIVACSEAFNDLNKLQSVNFGGPMFMGFDLSTDTLGVCLISSEFVDRVIVNTPCKKQILRMWTVRQTFCTYRDTIVESPQLITLIDTVPPVITVPDTIIASGNTFGDCLVTFSLPGLTAEDACDEDVTISIFQGLLPTFYDGTTLRLPIDTHTLYVQAYDRCHNISNDTFVVILQDETPPVSFCLSQMVISLNNNGVATVPAEKFDDGSYDACGNVTLSARRMSSSCDVQTITPGPEVQFCCADVGSEVMVELTATDESGHSSICMISVEIQDKDIPNIHCPPNLTVDCNFITVDYSEFGSVVEQGNQKILEIDPNDVITASGPLTDGVIFGNCMDTVLVNNSQSLDQCGLGSISRTFAARTMSGIESSCIQLITIIHDGNTNKPAITYPSDTTLITCDEGDATPAITGSPSAAEGRCNMIGFSHQDLLVNPQDTTVRCLKIIRTWTAFEACVSPTKVIDIDSQIIYLEKVQGNNLIIEGTVTSIHNEAVSKVAVGLKSLSSVLNHSETDNSGQYAFGSMPSGGKYNIIPFKDDNWSNGVSTLDLIQIQNHILGKSIINDGYNMIAADVNNDANISAIDLVHLRKIILGIDHQVKNNTSWRFVWNGDDIKSRLNLSSPIVEEYNLDALSKNMQIDWTGIKVGDLSGNAVANGIEKSESRSNELLTLSWELKIQDGQKQLYLFSPTLSDFNGIQGEFHLPSSINIKRIRNGQINMTSENIHVDNANERLTFSFSTLSPMKINANVPLFSIEINGAIDIENNLLALGMNAIMPEIYTNLNARKYTLEKVINDDNQFELSQNEPNPWKESAAITVIAQSDGDADFNIYDVQGRKILSRKISLRTGQNTIVVRKEEVSIVGVLLYELVFDDNVITKKMIKVE